MSREHQIIVAGTCLGILTLCLILINIKEETPPAPKDMSTPQLIESLEEESSLPRMDMVNELLHRQPTQINFEDSSVYDISVKTIKTSLASPSLETRREAFKALITFPPLLKALKGEEETLSKTAEELNQKIGKRRYRVQKIGGEIRIKTDYIMRPIEVTPGQ